MLHVFVIIAVAAIALAGGTAVAVKWDDIVIWWKGKRIAVLGARAVGKTRLIHFLTSGSLPVEEKQTVAATPVASGRRKLAELDLKLKETRDVPGAEAYPHWKKLVEEADIAFYLLRADLLLAGDQEANEQVRRDVAHIAGWLAQAKRRPLFCLLGTHCDLDPEYASFVSEGRLGEYQDRFSRLETVRLLRLSAGGDEKARLFVGSLRTEEDCEALVQTLFSQVVA